MAASSATSGITQRGELVLAVASTAYLGRYRGQTRIHTESDLRVFVHWCTAMELDPLAAVCADIERYVRWLQDVRCYLPSTVSRRLSVVVGFYRVCVIDQILPYPPAAYVRRPTVPAESATLGLGHLQFEALITTARLHRQRMLLERRSTVFVSGDRRNRTTPTDRGARGHAAADRGPGQGDRVAEHHHRGVLPAADGLRAGTGNSFSIFRSGPKQVPDVVYLEHVDRGEYFSDLRASEPYNVHMQAILIEAKKTGPDGHGAQADRAGRRAVLEQCSTRGTRGAHAPAHPGRRAWSRWPRPQRSPAVRVWQGRAVSRRRWLGPI
jgi:hypothetical protein